MSTIKSLASDPAGGTVAFARAHWAPSIGKMLAFLVPGKDNSVRAFDPVTNAWNYLWPTGIGNGGVHPRDNFASLLNPKLNELWVWGGSYMEQWPGALRSGRFSLSTNKWLATSTTDEGAFTAVIKNFSGFAIDMGCAWSEKLDTGIIFGGSIQGNPSERQWIIEPNPAGPEPYIMSEFAQNRPPARDQACNLLIATPDAFYLLSGHSGNDATGNWLYNGDFWKFSNRTWTRLPDPPASAYQACLTYDSDLNLIVAWVGPKLYSFSIALNAWSDVTPAGLPNVGNQLGVYCPSAKLHVYEGGNNWAAGGANFQQTVGISTGGGTVTTTNWLPNIPLKTWVAIPLPTTPNAPGGMSASSPGSKHLRWATNPVDGRTYELGGDYSTVLGNSWYGLWSVDVLTNSWRQEYPFDGIKGEIMLGARDEIGWLWDAKRKVFWIVPGFIYNTPAFKPSLGTEVYGTMLQFDPVTKKFIDPKAALSPIQVAGTQNPKNGARDEKTDSIFQWGSNGNFLAVEHYHCDTNKWDTYETSRAADGTYTNGTDIGFEYIALDPTRRKLYAVDPYDYRLFEFDIDTHILKIKAAIPEPNPGRIALARARTWGLKDFCNPVFDTINGVLLFPYLDGLEDDPARGAYGSRPQLLIYHPDTDTWEKDAMKQLEGIAIRGNSFWFDPVHNLFCAFGGLAKGGDADKTMTHWFQYRYANGDGIVIQPPIDPPIDVPPVNPPSTLKVTFTGIGEDKTGNKDFVPDGAADFHFAVEGLRGASTKVRVESDNAGVWEFPYNNANWIANLQRSASDKGDLWISQFAGAKKFHVKIFYTDKTMDEADAVAAVVVPVVADVIITLKKGTTYEIRYV